MLRLEAAGAETLWNELLPAEVRAPPADLAALDALLGDPGLLAPIAAHWAREAQASGRSALEHGRPTIAMPTYVRLMVAKHPHGWGYRTLVAEVSDSLHLRRFCRIGLSERVPDESTVRKLTRRLGPEVVAELSRPLIVKATRAALSPARGQDRRDGDRGRRALPDLRRPGGPRRARAGPRAASFRPGPAPG